jgi:tripartite-type tricarboxylate transporter receptor subunit TctC
VTLVRRLKVRGLTVWLPVLFAAVLFASEAQSTSDFYQGRTVRIVVGYDAGGGYDVVARLIAQHLSRFIPGNPTVVVQNMPGAGSLNAANFVASAAPQDGTVIAALNAVLPFQPLLDAEGARFDPLKVHWLPTPNSETALVTVWHTAPIQSLEDARKQDVLLGSSGQNSSSGFYGRIFNELFGTRFKLIVGYTGEPQTYVAMERGEVHGHGSTTWNSLRRSYADAIKDKKIRLILQYGAKPHPELAGVPFAGDLAKSEDDRLLLEIATGALVLGRPYMMGANVPIDRIEIISKAFEAMFRDPVFIADAKLRKIDVEPVSAAEVRDLIRRAYEAPKPVLERLRRLYKSSVQ